MICLLYLIFIVFFIASSRYKKRYLKKIKKFGCENQISVIIPARDEEKNISDILDSVLKQNYNSESYEVIVVNDRSEDGTQKIVEEFQKENKNLKLINIIQNDSGLSGKQNALDVGIKKAIGNIIIITDADCVVNKNWIKSMNKLFYNDDIGMVVGKTGILDEVKKSFPYKFQVMAHRLLMDIAQVPIMFGFYTSGMGNNLAFKKEGYLALGGYEGLGDSILDDEILVRGFARKGYKMAAAFSKNAIVKTKAMPNMAKVFKQHKRWVVGSLNIFTPSGILTFLLFCINIFAMYSIVTLYRMDWTNILGIIAKFTADIFLVIKLNRADEGKVLNVFDEILVGIFMGFYLVVLGTVSILNRKTSWKNENYKMTKSKMFGKEKR